MRFHIDRFIKIGGVFIVQGWSDSFHTGDSLTLTAETSFLETVTRSIMRSDLPTLFGSGSERWGFRAYGIDDGITSPSATSIGLTFPNGDRIEKLSEASVPQQDHIAHMVWVNFVAEVNAKGGRLLEIGSRARSGSTIRDQFGDNIEYIGVDVTDGPNVSVVSDAHHLSDAIIEPVDYVCSISTFEHFMMPWKVALEINKILKPGGRVFSHSHQTWPEHDVPFDYFRFSEQAWSGIFNSHTGFRIVETKVGHPVSVSAIYNVGGPFDEMEYSPGHAMSVCVAEKIAEPLVKWEAAMQLVNSITYEY